MLLKDNISKNQILQQDTNLINKTVENELNQTKTKIEIKKLKKEEKYIELQERNKKLFNDKILEN